MMTQFLVVISTTLLSVGHKVYSVFKHPARGPVAGAHLVAVVATAAGGLSSHSIKVRTTPRLAIGAETFSSSLACSTNLCAITGENSKEPTTFKIKNEDKCMPVLKEVSEGELGQIYTGGAPVLIK